jgi:polar amino acid transport system permease protein
VQLDAFWTAVIAIGCNSSAYLSQIFRSGIQSINRGQFEAAYVLGFSKIQTLRYIILVQALTIIFPALGNEFITLVKDSSLASIIGVSELSKEGRLIISRTYDAISIFTMIAILYLVVTLSMSLLIYQFEYRMRRHVKD